MTLTTGVQCLTHNLDLAIPRLTRRQLNMACFKNLLTTFCLPSKFGMNLGIRVIMFRNLPMHVSFKILSSKLRHILRDFQKTRTSPKPNLGTTAGAHYVRTVNIRQKKGQNRAAEWPLSVQGNGFAEFFIT